MIILSSDYDGTLNTRIHDLRINVRELKKYRELGNIFILNTGRPFESIKKEIDTFNIPFDYLCCNDGTAIFDKDLNVINETTLIPEQVNYIKNLVLYNGIFKISHFYTAKERLPFEIDNPIEIEVTKENKKHSFKELISNLKSEENNLAYYEWNNFLFIKNYSNKSTALEDIYTVGDEGNDLEMIQNHRGFRMLESSPKLWFKTWRVVPEVHYLLKYLICKSKYLKMKEKVKKM